MATERNNHEPFEDRAAGKAYSSPKLIMYGDIREITQAFGGMGMNDMASGPQKTGA